MKIECLVDDVLIVDGEVDSACNDRQYGTIVIYRLYEDGPLCANTVEQDIYYKISSGLKKAAETHGIKVYSRRQLSEEFLEVTKQEFKESERRCGSEFGKKSKEEQDEVLAWKQVLQACCLLF